jgi:O-antigen ligase
VRTGVAQEVNRATGEAFGHPHSAYIEFAMDNGVIGLGLVLAFLGMVLFRSVAMFRDRLDPLATSVGGLTIGLVLSFLIAGIGAQTFYPINSTVAMWCSVGLALRLWEERKKVPLATAAVAQSPVEVRSIVPRARSTSALPRPAPAALWPSGGSGPVH